MPITPFTVIDALWVTWAISWIVAAVWSGRTAIRVARTAAVPYRVLQALGVLVLIYRRFDPPGLGWPVDTPVRWAMAGLVAAGLAFCWWARLHLGSLWSGTVERKEGHRVVDTGPYAIVRHPIYTGLLLAAYATAVAEGALFALVGASLLLTAWYLKARLEEGLLRAELGQDAYAAYAARVPMLVPFLKI